MKLAVKKRNIEGTETYIPDIQVRTDEGRKPNRDLPEEIQIRAEIRYASKQERSKYFKTTFNKDREMSFHSDFPKVMDKHVTAIHGLEAYGITNGKTLYAHHAEAEEFSELVGDLFNEVCGMNGEDTLEGE